MKQNCALFIITCSIISTLNTIIVCNPFLQPAILQEYANVIHEKGAPLENCSGFIDGTVIEICRPKPIYQRIVYNGHKRVHSIKFQSLALPNDLIENLSGPYEGRRHDSTMLHESSLLNDLRRFAWYNNQPLCIYGDPAYQLSVHLQAPYRQAQNNQDMINYNKAMSEAESLWNGFLAVSKTILNSLISRKK